MDNSGPPEGRNSELKFAMKDRIEDVAQELSRDGYISGIRLEGLCPLIFFPNINEIYNLVSTIAMLMSATRIQAYKPFKGASPREVLEALSHTPTSHQDDLLPCELSLHGCNCAFHPRTYTSWSSGRISYLRKQHSAHSAPTTSWKSDTTSYISLQFSHWEGHLSRVPGRLLGSSGKRLDQLWSRVQTAASKNEYLDKTITYLHRPPILFLLSTMTFTLATLSLRHAHRSDRYQDRIVAGCALAGVVSALLLVQFQGEEGARDVVMSLKAHLAWGIAVGLVLSWIAHRVGGLVGARIRVDNEDEEWSVNKVVMMEHD